MKNIIVMQECSVCGKRFPLRYFEDGTYEYISETCNCEAGFNPINGSLSISEWLDTLER
jgi:hypothetical protein